MPDRKKFIAQLGGGLLLAGIPETVFGGTTTDFNIQVDDFTGGGSPGDEKFWNRISRKYYDLSTGYTNLENGYYGVQPKPVLAAYQKNILLANRGYARFARKEFPALSAGIKKELAVFLGVSDEEIIITRNATEALNIAIQGYPFRPGDEVLISQLDYFSMIETFRLLEKRGQLKVNSIELPLRPVNDEEIVDAYRKAITPRTRVILLTHVSNINGLVVPVKKIAELTRTAGIDTITDSAHALGQIPFSLRELGSDFVGLNLHKWIGNPIGAGVLYIKKERIREIRPLFGDVAAGDDNISKLAHFGTTPFSVIMTIPESISFHRLLGTERINKRLHYLKATWMNPLQDHPGIEIVSPSGEGLSCAIASFRVKNRKSSEIANELFEKYNILTVARNLGKDGCVRVTTGIYNSVPDVQKLVKGVQQLAG